MEQFLTEGAPIDMDYFESLSKQFYTGNPEQSNEVNQIFMRFSERNDSWISVKDVFQVPTAKFSKLISLTLFKNNIQAKWGILSYEQRDFFKVFFFQLTIECNKESKQCQKFIRSCLISILKLEWPNNWPKFMHNLLQEARQKPYSNISVLEVLSSLSDDIFDPHDEMISNERKTELSRALESEFPLIFSYLEATLTSTDEALLSTALFTLSHYLRWIDLSTILSAPITRHFSNDFLPNPNLRCSVLACFDAIAMHSSAVVDSLMINIFENIIRSINATIPEGGNIVDTYSDDASFLSLTQTLSKFLLLDDSGLLQGQMPEASMIALSWYIQITDRAEGVAFKVSVETWRHISEIFYHESQKIQTHPDLINAIATILIRKMVPPEEFNPLLSADDPTDQELYEAMRCTLVCLTHLLPGPIRDQIIQRIMDSHDGNTLISATSAAGAVSGAIPTSDEALFVRIILGRILELTGIEMELQEKIIVCSSFLYLASQYPRFLFNDWVCYRTLFNKIIESFLSCIPPLQSVALNSLNMLALRCPRPLLIIHPPDTISPTNELLDKINELVSKLPGDLVSPLYSALANLIKQNTNQNEKITQVIKLLKLPIKRWEKSCDQLNSETALDPRITSEIIFPLNIFGKIILIYDEAFYPQIETVLLHTINLYDFYSKEIVKYPNEINFNLVHVKNEILSLYESFFQAHPHSENIPKLIQLIIEDYSSTPTDFKCSKILDCLSTIISQLKEEAEPYIQPIIQNIVQPTMEIIKESYDHIPDIRLPFFSLLSKILSHFFMAISSFDLNIFSEMLKCLLWGISHPTTDISSVAMNCIDDIISSVSQANSEFQNDFYDSFYLLIMGNLVEFLSDRIHKFLFFQLSKALQHEFLLLAKPGLTIDGRKDIQNAVMEFLSRKLENDFPHLKPDEIHEFIGSLLSNSQSIGKFRELLRDFLIGTKKITPSDPEIFHDSTEMENVSGYAGPAEPEIYGDVSEF